MYAATGVTQDFLETIKSQKLNYLKHVIRKPAPYIEY